MTNHDAICEFLKAGATPEEACWQTKAIRDVRILSIEPERFRNTSRIGGCKWSSAFRLGVGSRCSLSGFPSLASTCFCSTGHVAEGPSS